MLNKNELILPSAYALEGRGINPGTQQTTILNQISFWRVFTCPTSKFIKVTPDHVVLFLLQLIFKLYYILLKLRSQPTYSVAGVSMEKLRVTPSTPGLFFARAPVYLVAEVIRFISNPWILANSFIFVYIHLIAVWPISIPEC